jgi:hypothetical protein
MSSSKKNCPVKGLCGKCLSVSGPEPHTPPLTNCILVYSILIHTGKGERGGEVSKREGFTKLGRKYQYN